MVNMRELRGILHESERVQSVNHTDLDIILVLFLYFSKEYRTFSESSVTLFWDLSLSLVANCTHFSLHILRFLLLLFSFPFVFRVRESTSPPTVHVPVTHCHCHTPPSPLELVTRREDLHLRQNFYSHDFFA